MVIETLTDITGNQYLFDFKYIAGEPDFPPILEGDVTIWIASEGIVIKGKKLAGKIGKSVFRVGGTTTNSPLSTLRVMLCKWEDISIYEPRIKRKISERVIMYPHKEFTYKAALIKCVAAMKHANICKNQILRVHGNGVDNQVLKTMVSRGILYKEDLYIMILCKNREGYGFKKLMTINEFKKIEEDELWKRSVRG